MKRTEHNEFFYGPVYLFISFILVFAVHLQVWIIFTRHQCSDKTFNKQGRTHPCVPSCPGALWSLSGAHAHSGAPSFHPERRRAADVLMLVDVLFLFLNAQSRCETNPSGLFLRYYPPGSFQRT